MPSAAYYRRIFQAYLGRGTSQLTFWHERPELEESAFGLDPARYFMTFAEKADYAGPFDADGVPLLDYRGALGRRYNPIAIAQYGLARWNRYRRAGREDDLGACLRAADWLAANLETGDGGLAVWRHHFDWEYYRPLRAPWPSALAQGQGISLLLRAALGSGRATYADAAVRAFAAMTTPVEEGGLLWVEPGGGGASWLEEYLTAPPTHILNGCFWALWGVYDLFRPWEAGAGIGEGVRQAAEGLWRRVVATAVAWLPRYDTGYWSRYDLAPTRLPNVASAFYHRLHLVQLEAMRRMTKEEAFARAAARWSGCAARRTCRTRAFAAKALFKLVYF